MESFLSLILVAWGAIAPYLAFLDPIAKLASPVLAQLSPVLSIVSGPLSFVIVYLLLPVYALWLFYLAVMNLKRARDAKILTGVAYAFGVPILLVGWALDVFVNLTFCSILFADLPRESTMTARLKRYATQPGTWRFTLTVWFATHFLDKFDPDGYHVAEVYIAASNSLGEHSTEKEISAVQKVADNNFEPV